MKAKILIILLLFYSFSCKLYGQDSSSCMNQRDFVWTTPVKKNTTINGIGIGLIMAVPWMGADSLKINGLNLDLGLFGAFGSVYALFGSLAAPFIKSTKSKDEADDINTVKIYPDTSSSIGTVVRGVSLSFGGIGRETNIDGVSLNGGISFAQEMNGFEMTGLLNLHYEFKGLMIAGLRNKVTRGKGLQIGLFNNCKDGQVFQIGLLNRIGNRILPVFNFRFKSRMKD